MIVSFDLSLTSTGWAELHRSHADGPHWGTVVPPPAAKAPMGERLECILNTIHERCRNGCELVVIEAPVVRSSAAVAIGRVHGVALLVLYRLGIPVIEVPPASVKMLATGKGNAGKDDVRGAARSRLGYTGESDDEADALWLADAGARLLGWDRPDLPQTHLRALAKLALPTGLAAA